MTNIQSLIKLSRPAHAVKNLLVVLPPFFGHRFGGWEMLWGSVLALCSFSLIASVVYVFNDLRDRENDRKHPKKCKRPIASGEVSVTEAWGLIAFLMLCGGGLIFFSSGSLVCSLILLVYLLTNIAYSIFLKNCPVVDIFVLALGFVLRVYFGGAWFCVTISPWLFLCVMCGALWFATGKRRNELLHAGNDGTSRPVLKKYTMSYLNSSYYLLCGVSIVFFSLWTILGVRQNYALQFSIPLVIFILFRYNFIMETTDADGDPLPMLLKDKILMLLSLLFGIASFIGVYIILKIGKSVH